MARTILLADDSMTIQKVVELTFMDQDYQVVAVSDGSTAISKLSEMAPDLVIADVHMPGADGYTVCRQTKESRHGTPVLLLVGTFEQFDEQQAAAAGADASLKKPFDSQELLAQVEALVAGPAAGAPTPGFAAPDHAAPDPLAAPPAADPPGPPAAGPGDPPIRPYPVAPADAWATRPPGSEPPLPETAPGPEAPLPEAPAHGDPPPAVPPAYGPADSPIPPPVMVAGPPSAEAVAPTPEAPAPPAYVTPSFEMPSTTPSPAVDVSTAPPLEVPPPDAGLDTVRAAVPTGMPEPVAGPEAAPETRLIETPYPVAPAADQASAAPDLAGAGSTADPAVEPHAEVEAVADPAVDPHPGVEGAAGAMEEARAEAGTGDSAAGAGDSAAGAGEPVATLSDDDVDRIARRVVELLGESGVKEVAWEVVPDLAEVIIRERIRELESQAETA
ncbi:MAG: response regulator [Holophagales bacterium]|nr:response regulator [Holophagales bacterium]